MSIYREGESVTLTKKAHVQSTYDITQVQQLAKCMVDSMYFMENFMYIQHPTKGRLLFEPYDFQREMINTISENRFSILLTGRQLGKTVTFNCKISKNGSQIEVGSLISLSFREKIINKLELLLLKLSK